MPDHSPSTDERASLAQPSQSSSPLECTSHLGFSLDTSSIIYSVGRDEPYFLLFSPAWQQSQVPYGSGEVKTRMPKRLSL